MGSLLPCLPQAGASVILEGNCLLHSHPLLQSQRLGVGTGGRAARPTAVHQAPCWKKERKKGRKKNPYTTHRVIAVSLATEQQSGPRARPWSLGRKARDSGGVRVASSLPWPRGENLFKVTPTGPWAAIHNGGADVPGAIGFGVQVGWALGWPRRVLLDDFLWSHSALHPLQL